MSDDISLSLESLEPIRSRSRMKYVVIIILNVIIFLPRFGMKPRSILRTEPTFEVPQLIGFVWFLRKLNNLDFDLTVLKKTPIDKGGKAFCQLPRKLH